MLPGEGVNDLVKVPGIDADNLDSSLRDLLRAVREIPHDEQVRFFDAVDEMDELGLKQFVEALPSSEESTPAELALRFIAEHPDEIGPNARALFSYTNLKPSRLVIEDGTNKGQVIREAMRERARQWWTRPDMASNRQSMVALGIVGNEEIADLPKANHVRMHGVVIDRARLSELEDILASGTYRSELRVRFEERLKVEGFSQDQANEIMQMFDFDANSIGFARGNLTQAQETRAASTTHDPDWLPINFGFAPDERIARVYAESLGDMLARHTKGRVEPGRIRMGATHHGVRTSYVDLHQDKVMGASPKNPQIRTTPGADAREALAYQVAAPDMFKAVPVIDDEVARVVKIEGLDPFAIRMHLDEAAKRMGFDDFAHFEEAFEMVEGSNAAYNKARRIVARRTKGEFSATDVRDEVAQDLWADAVAATKYQAEPRWVGTDEVQVIEDELAELAEQGAPLALPDQVVEELDSSLAAGMPQTQAIEMLVERQLSEVAGFGTTFNIGNVDDGVHTEALMAALNGNLGPAHLGRANTAMMPRFSFGPTKIPHQETSWDKIKRGFFSGMVEPAIGSMVRTPQFVHHYALALDDMKPVYDAMLNPGYDEAVDWIRDVIFGGNEAEFNRFVDDVDRLGKNVIDNTAGLVDGDFRTRLDEVGPDDLENWIKVVLDPDSEPGFVQWATNQLFEDRAVKLDELHVQSPSRIFAQRTAHRVGPNTDRSWYTAIETEWTDKVYPELQRLQTRYDKIVDHTDPYFETVTDLNAANRRLAGDHRTPQVLADLGYPEGFISADYLPDGVFWSGDEFNEVVRKADSLGDVYNDQRKKAVDLLASRVGDMARNNGVPVEDLDDIASVVATWKLSEPGSIEQVHEQLRSIGWLTDNQSIDTLLREVGHADEKLEAVGRIRGALFDTRDHITATTLTVDSPQIVGLKPSEGFETIRQEEEALVRMLSGQELVPDIEPTVLNHMNDALYQQITSDTELVSLSTTPLGRAYADHYRWDEAAVNRAKRNPMAITTDGSPADLARAKVHVTPEGKLRLFRSDGRQLDDSGLVPSPDEGKWYTWDPDKAREYKSDTTVSAEVGADASGARPDGVRADESRAWNERSWPSDEMHYVDVSFEDAIAMATDFRPPGDKYGQGIMREFLLEDEWVLLPHKEQMTHRGATNTDFGTRLGPEVQRLRVENNYRQTDFAEADRIRHLTPDEMAGNWKRDTNRSSSEVVRAAMGGTDYVDDPDQIRALRTWLRNRVTAYSRYQDGAVQRAINMTVPFIDDHRVRSQFQEYIGTLAPFWFATENFAKRWARVGMEDIHTFRRMQFWMESMRQIGVVESDERTGDEYWHVPIFSDLFMDFAERVVTPIFGAAPGGLDTLGQMPTSMTLPGLNDDPLAGQAGPLLSVGLTAVAARYPEFEPHARSLVVGGHAQRGQAMTVWDAFMPTTIKKLHSAAFGDMDQAALAQLQFDAAKALELRDVLPDWNDLPTEIEAALVTQGHSQETYEMEVALNPTSTRTQLVNMGMELPQSGFDPNASVIEQEKWLEEVRDYSRTLAMTQTITGFFGPVSPSIEFRDLVDDEFASLLDEMPANLALEVYTQRHPDRRAMTVFATDRESMAAMPATEASLAFMQRNGETIQNYRAAAPWFMPAARPDAGFDSRSWAEQSALGLRDQKDLEGFVADLHFAEAAEEYFQVADNYHIRRRAADMNGDSEEKRRLDSIWNNWSTVYRNQHPLFDSHLTSGDGRARREATLNEMSVLVNHPDMLAESGSFGVAMQELMGVWDNYSRRRSGLANVPGQSATSRRAHLAEVFLDWGQTFVTNNPEMIMFWNTVMVPEIRVHTDYVTDELTVGVV